MIQALVVKLVINKVMDAIEKADDKRIKKLEKIAHEPSDWVCLKCGCKAKKKEKVTRRKNG